MASVAKVLQSQQLVQVIAKYQHGIHADMRPLVCAIDPVKTRWVSDSELATLFASLDAAIMPWYSEWGHARLFKLFACAPQMQRRVIAHALWSGNLSVLTLLPVEMLREEPRYMVALATSRDDMSISVLKYLHDVVGLNISTPQAMYRAAASGHLDVIRYLYELNNDTDVQMASIYAADHGHLEAIEFFHHYCACDLGNAFVCAIQNEDLVVAQFILDLVGKDSLNRPHVMDTAASPNRMESLKWLHGRGFACSTDAMNYAAGKGYLGVVQWLHANRSEGCTQLAMHKAAANGHLDVVEWLFANRREGCTAATLEETTSNKHWQVVRFLGTHGVVNNPHEALTTAQENSDTPPDVVALLESAVIDSNGRHQKGAAFNRL